MIEKKHPHLAVIDLLLGTDDGMQFIKECKSRFKKMKILVLSMQDESVYAERVIRAGADGFLAKSDSPEKLVEAVNTVLKGEMYLSRQSSSRILGRVLRDKEDDDQNTVKALSDRELHVFQMIGCGMATKDIAKFLGLSGKTIESHREKIKTKLSLKDAKILRACATQWVQTGKLTTRAD